MSIAFIVVEVSWVCAYVQTHRIVHSKYVLFLECQLYLRLLIKQMEERHGC